MKIEIMTNDLSGCSDYKIYCKDKNCYLSGTGMFPRNFDLNDIYNLIGEKNFQKFEDDVKYQFNVTGKVIYAVTKDMRFYRPQDFRTGQDMAWLDSF